MRPFFSYSDFKERIANRIFNKKGYCLSTFYLKPDGDSNYTSASKIVKNGKLEKVCYNYLSDTGERFLQYYNSENKIKEQKWIRTGDILFDTRYFYYEKDNLAYEEAYGSTNHLYEKVFYTYDDRGNCIKKEVRGFPYDMLISSKIYKYDSSSKLIEQEIYRYDKLLIEKIYYFLDEKGSLKEKIIYYREKSKILKKIYRYQIEYDEKGNWISQLEIEIMKKRDRWIEEPQFLYKRVIEYYEVL